MHWNDIVRNIQQQSTGKPSSRVPVDNSPRLLAEMEAQVPFDSPDPTSATSLDRDSYVAQKNHGEIHKHLRAALDSLAAARACSSHMDPQGAAHQNHLNDLEDATQLAEHHINGAIKHLSRANKSISE